MRPEFISKMLLYTTGSINMEMEGKYESLVVHSPKQWITSQLPSTVWTIQKACVDHAFTIKVLIKIYAEKGKNQINHWQYRFHIPKGSGFKCMSDENLQALNNLESRKYNKKWRIWNCNPKCTGFFYVFEKCCNGPYDVHTIMHKDVYLFILFTMFALLFDKPQGEREDHGSFRKSSWSSIIMSLILIKK